MDFLVPKRRLGKPIMTKDNESYNQSLKEETQTIICGQFEQNQKLSVRICVDSQSNRSMNSFYFITQTLTDEQVQLLNLTCDIRIPTTNALMYSARPYNVDFESNLIYREQTSNYNYTMMRCKIVDLFTINVNQSIEMRAKIYLIDEGRILKSVPFTKLFEYPQRINYFKQIEPSAKECRLYIGSPIPLDYYDPEINEYFCKLVSKYNNHNVTIKILDYKNGIYHIDILNPKGQSIIEHLRQRYQNKIYKVEKELAKELNSSSQENANPSVCQLLNELGLPQDGIVGYESVFASVYTVDRKAELNHRICNISNNLDTKKYHNKRYSGALEYFASKLLYTNDGDGNCYMKKRFFQVLVNYWDDPDSIYIIPDDPEYTKIWKDYKIDIERYLNYCKNNYTQQHEIEPYKLGEKCLFKHDGNIRLGNWLRGIVTEVPKIHPEDGYYSFEDHDDPNFIESPLPVYKVRSIDYGFTLIRGPLNMKHIIDDRFFRKGPWSLKCRLFGMKPLEEKSEYGELCINMMDNWLKEKNIIKSEQPKFYALFRTDFKNHSYRWQTPEPSFDITLFNRYEPPNLFEDWVLTMRKRRTKFDCLNTDLIDRGAVASSCRGQNTSSNVQLDEHLVNLLVPHDRI